MVLQTAPAIEARATSKVVANATTVYRDLLTHAAPAAVAHEVLVSITVDITKVTARSKGASPVLGAAMLFGLMVGNVLVLHPLLLAEAFGVADYPRIYARSQLVLSLGYAFGPFLLGWLRDNAGGYRTSYLVAAGLSAVGVIMYALGTRLASDRAFAAAASP